MQAPDPLAQEQTWNTFRRELYAATQANLRYPAVDGWRSTADAMRWLRSRLPYRFDPSREVASLWVAVQRRWGSCAEAAAAIAAWALRNRKSVMFALERRPDLDPAYAHVVARVDGRDVDVYAEAARPVNGATFLWPVTP